MKQTRDTREALAVFRRHGGVMSTSEALAAGVHPAALYGLLQEGRLERLARGLYRSAGAREFSNPDLAVVARKAPDAVVCLESALAFHGITTQIPRRVHVAVPRGSYSGLRLRSPPVAVHRFAAEHFAPHGPWSSHAHCRQAAPSHRCPSRTANRLARRCARP